MAAHDSVFRCDTRFAVLGIAGVLSVSAVAAPPVGSPLSFVACPIVRDLGPDTDVCFFAEYDGENYALVNPPDWGNPQLKHRVLVEARVAEGDPVCGAQPLDARISVLFEIDASCDTVLPFDGVPRPARPQSEAILDLARRVGANPALSLEPVRPEVPYPEPVPPFRPETLMIYYPFGSDRATDGDMRELLRLRDIARTVPATVEVIGYRGASRLTDGSALVERTEMARIRAEKIVDVLQGLGIRADRISVDWVDAAGGDTGQDDWKSRRVELRVIPVNER